MIVILDSNSWLEDVHLRSNKFASLFAFLKRTKSSLVIAEIVLEEVLAVYRRRLEQAIVSAEQAFDELKDLAVSPAAAGYFKQSHQKSILRTRFDS